MYDDDEARREQRVRMVVPPAALVLALLIVSSDTGRSLFRVLFTMWLHELGHALTAWLCGFAAFPGPWRTTVADARSPLVTIVLLAGLAALAWRFERTDRRRLIAFLAAPALLAVVLTLGLRRDRAEALILFFGDGGALVLGAALMATFYAGEDSYLRTSFLRWGFVVIGAFGVADPFSVWWRARRDPEAIPFGEIDGVGDSDASRLVDAHGWSAHSLVSRYVALGVVCLLALAALYLWHTVLRSHSDRSDKPS